MQYERRTRNCNGYKCHTHLLKRWTTIYCVLHAVKSIIALYGSIKEPINGFAEDVQVMAGQMHNTTLKPTRFR